MKFIKDIIDGRIEYVADDNDFPILVKETSSDCWEIFTISEDGNEVKVTDETLPKNRKWKSPTSTTAKKAKERTGTLIKHWRSSAKEDDSNELTIEDSSETEIEDEPVTQRVVQSPEEFRVAIERAREILSRTTGKERRRLRSNLSQIKRGAKKDWVIPKLCDKLECSPEHLNHILQESA